MTSEEKACKIVSDWVRDKESVALILLRKSVEISQANCTLLLEEYPLLEVDYVKLAAATGKVFKAFVQDYCFPGNESEASLQNDLLELALSLVNWEAFASSHIAPLLGEEYLENPFYGFVPEERGDVS